MCSLALTYSPVLSWVQDYHGSKCCRSILIARMLSGQLSNALSEGDICLCIGRVAPQRLLFLHQLVQKTSLHARAKSPPWRFWIQWKRVPQVHLPSSCGMPSVCPLPNPECLLPASPHSPSALRCSTVCKVNWCLAGASAAPLSLGLAMVVAEQLGSQTYLTACSWHPATTVPHPCTEHSGLGYDN